MDGVGSRVVPHVCPLAVVVRFEAENRAIVLRRTPVSAHDDLLGMRSRVNCLDGEREGGKGSVDREGADQVES